MRRYAVAFALLLGACAPQERYAYKPGQPGEIPATITAAPSSTGVSITAINDRDAGKHASYTLSPGDNVIKVTIKGTGKNALDGEDDITLHAMPGEHYTLGGSLGKGTFLLWIKNSAHKSVAADVFKVEPG